MKTGNKVVVAISGGGRSLANLLQQQHQYSYEIAGVIASNENCAGLTIARDHGLMTKVENFSLKVDQQALKKNLYAWVEQNHFDWIALAGFLKIFPCERSWHNRVINIHPALLPKYGGKGMYGHFVHEAVAAAGDRESGASIHYVNERYDEGAVIARIRVPIAPGTSSEDIARQVFKAECQLYPKVLDGLCRGELPLPEQKVFEYGEQY